jgi:hypothetical protein
MRAPGGTLTAKLVVVAWESPAAVAARGLDSPGETTYRRFSLSAGAGIGALARATTSRSWFRPETPSLG